MEKNLFKLVYNENLDSDNKVYGSWSVYLKLGTENVLLYNTFSEEWAKLAMKRLKDIYDTYIYSFITGTNVPTMFERDDAIYKLEYIFPEQSCVVGSQIPGNKFYSTYEVEPQKYDYIQDIIFFYNKGECLVKNNQLFLNGDLLLNNKELKQVCDKIGQDFNSLDNYNDKLIHYLSTTYPEAKTYTCNGYHCFNISTK